MGKNLILEGSCVYKMGYNIKPFGKDKELASMLLRIELNAKNIKYEEGYHKETTRVDNTDSAKVRRMITKLKSPRPLSFEVSEY